MDEPHFHSSCFQATCNRHAECFLARLSNLTWINDWEAVSPDTWLKMVLRCRKLSKCSSPAPALELSQKFRYL